MNTSTLIELEISEAYFCVPYHHDKRRILGRDHTWPLRAPIRNGSLKTSGPLSIEWPVYPLKRSQR